MDAGVVLAGRYRLVERLGEGGMSVVWRARDEVLARDVAVKLLSTRYLTDWTSRQRIRAEAQAAAKLSHPNIAGVFDYGESEAGPGEERVPYIVMELLSGSTLAERLESGPLPIPEVLKIGAAVAAALAAAHEQDIVHRDVKPANVMVTAGGTAKMVDFGVAAIIGDLAEHGSSSVLFGTPAYVAPERLEGGPVVAGTDVYGLGVLLYRMLTGYMPWSAESTTQMLIAHMYVAPEPLPQLSGLPADVAEICQACLEKDPADRPAAAEVAAVLSAAARDAGESPAPADRSGPQAAAAARHRRSRQLAMAGAVVAVVVAAVTAAALVRPDGTPRANSAPVAERGDQAAADPAVTVGVGGVGGPSGGGATGQPGHPGEPGAIDPRQADPPLVTTPAQPGGPGTPTTTTTTAQPDPIEASDEQYGNKLTVRCVGITATIVATTSADGWSVTRINPGPAEQVNVRFESATIAPYFVSFRARCTNGTPRINRG